MLYDCTECDKSISESASHCPHCGLKDAGPRARSYWLGPRGAARRAERGAERERKKESDNVMMWVLGFMVFGVPIILHVILPLFRK